MDSLQLCLYSDYYIFVNFDYSLDIAIINMGNNKAVIFNHLKFEPAA